MPCHQVLHITHVRLARHTTATDPTGDLRQAEEEPPGTLADSVIIRRPWWARDEIGIATGLWQLRPTARRSLTPGRRALGHVLHGGVKSGTHLEPREGLGWATVPTTPSPDQEDATTTANMPLDDLLVELGDRDRDALRVILERTVQALVEAEVTAVIGADRHERTQERVTYRKGHRARVLDTRVGRVCSSGVSC